MNVEPFGRVATLIGDARFSLFTTLRGADDDRDLRQCARPGYAARWGKACWIIICDLTPNQPILFDDVSVTSEVVLLTSSRNNLASTWHHSA